jgi:hypothetical protein
LVSHSRLWLASTLDDRSGGFDSWICGTAVLQDAGAIAAKISVTSTDRLSVALFTPAITAAKLCRLSSPDVSPGRLDQIASANPFNNAPWPFMAGSEGLSVSIVTFVRQFWDREIAVHEDTDGLRIEKLFELLNRRGVATILCDDELLRRFSRQLGVHVPDERAAE